MIPKFLSLAESRDTLQLYAFNPPFANPPAPANPGKGTPYPTIPGKGSPICSGGSTGIAVGGSVVAGGAAVGLSTSIGGTCPSGDSPGTGITLGTPGSALGVCYGPQIDYGVKCVDSTGLYVCYGGGALRTGSDENDPLGVCKNGPQTRSATLELPDGSTACEEFIKQYNFPPNPNPPGHFGLYFSSVGAFGASPYTHSGGSFQCQIQAAPC